MNYAYPELHALACAMKSQLFLGNQRFFTPTDKFWEQIKTIVPADVRLVDCGTGRGDLIGEGFDNGIKLIGIDLSGRENQSDLVIHADATTFRFDANQWPMFCRPSHDGWAYLAMQNARKAGAHALYVGLPRNYEKDIGSIRSKSLGVVGEEGERLYLIQPLKKAQP